MDGKKVQIYLAKISSAIEKLSLLIKEIWGKKVLLRHGVLAKRFLELALFRAAPAPVPEHTVRFGKYKRYRAVSYKHYWPNYRWIKNKYFFYKNKNHMF